MKHSKVLNSAILTVVENQLRMGNPPEVRQTWDRLLASGLPEEEVRRLIGCVVLNEIFQIANSGKPYDGARYVAALTRLPDMPAEWDKETTP